MSYGSILTVDAVISQWQPQSSAAERETMKLENELYRQSHKNDIKIAPIQPLRTVMRAPIKPTLIRPMMPMRPVMPIPVSPMRPKPVPYLPRRRSFQPQSYSPLYSPVQAQTLRAPSPGVVWSYPQYHRAFQIPNIGMQYQQIPNWNNSLPMQINQGINSYGYPGLLGNYGGLLHIGSVQQQSQPQPNQQANQDDNKKVDDDDDDENVDINLNTNSNVQDPNFLAAVINNLRGNPEIKDVLDN